MFDLVVRSYRFPVSQLASIQLESKLEVTYDNIRETCEVAEVTLGELLAKVALDKLRVMYRLSEIDKFPDRKPDSVLVDTHDHGLEVFLAWVVEKDRIVDNEEI